jgi:hypothetical protein
MEKCKLCKVNDADKTGSHIVPAFILKTLFERNKEFVFSIGSKNVSNHIGRELTPEKIEDYMGRQLTDEEIEKNNIPFIVDYIFCDSCEKRLGHLETIYSADVHQKIDGYKIESNQIISIENSSALISLFWYSVIWRLSVCNNTVFKLKAPDEGKLRIYLDNNVKTSVGDQKKHLKNMPDEIIYPLAICFNSNSVDKITSNLVEGNSYYKNPYLIYCNEYIVVLYFKISQVYGMKHSFYGLETVFEVKELINFGTSKDFKIGFLVKSIWEKIKENVFLERAATMNKELALQYKLAASHFNLQYNDNGIGSYLKRLHSEDDIELVDRYKKERVVKIMTEELFKLRMKRR